MTNRERKVIEKANETWLKGKNKSKNSIKHPWKVPNGFKNFV